MATETEEGALIRGREARRMRRALERKITNALVEQTKDAVHTNIDKIIAAISQGYAVQAAVQVGAPNQEPPKVAVDHFTGQPVTTTPGE